MRLFGLTGFPLGHSFSAEYFRKKFISEGITDCDYHLFPLEKIKLIRGVVMRNPELMGFNVTVPYKQTIIKCLDELDSDAFMIGAVNTVKVIRTGRRYRLKGYNTDHIGFKKLLVNAGATMSRRALVLGAGGAAAAVKFALEKYNIPVTFVVRKKLKNADYSESELSSALKRKDVIRIGYSDVDKKIMDYHNLIINTTPLGMYPETFAMPDIPYYFAGKSHIAIDLIYNPDETLFMKNFRERKAVAYNGLDMLYAQAEASWEIWNG